mgnify:CR=1 FL=1
MGCALGIEITLQCSPLVRSRARVAAGNTPARQTQKFVEILIKSGEVPNSQRFDGW